MIRDKEGLRRTREAVALLEDVLASLERDKAKIHPDWFAIMSEPPTDQLRELRAEIDEYLGVIKLNASAVETAVSVPG